MAQEFKKGKNEIVVGFTVQAYFLIPTLAPIAIALAALVRWAPLPMHNIWPKGIVALDLR